MTLHAKMAMPDSQLLVWINYHIFNILKTDYFLLKLGFLYKSDLRISTAGKL